MMSSIRLIAILSGAAAAMPLIMWLGLRLYAVISAAVKCRTCRTRASQEERAARCPMQENVMGELERAGRNMRLLLPAVLLLLTALWLLGSEEAQQIAVDGIGIGALVCGGLFLFARLTVSAAAMIIPSAMPCRNARLEAIRKSGIGCGWMTAAYALVHLLLSAAG